MTSLQPLLSLLGQSERERDALRVECQRAAAAQQTAEAQADQLLAYRRDYEQRWATQFRSDGRMELVNCYRGFMERLSQAVQQQQQCAAQADARLEQVRVALRDSETRAASVRKLIERRVNEARVHTERREQKASDEFAARSAWNAQAAAAHARLEPM